MSKIWYFLKIILALFLIFAGIQHFRDPDFFLKVIPPFLSAVGLPIVYISGVIEVVIGLMMLIHKYQVAGTYAFFVLMILFLPLHIWDVFAEAPFTGSKNAAIIRLTIQFVLIGLLWIIKNKLEKYKPISV